MSEQDRTVAPLPSARRIAVSVVGVAVVLVLVTIAALLLVNYDRADAENYIAVLNSTLSWPTVALSLTLGFLLIFSSHIGALINRVEEFHLPGGTSGTAPIRQPALPTATKPISFPGEEETAAPALPDGHAPEVERLEREARELREEATQWWHRFLTLFLTERSISVFTMIKLVSPSSEQILQWQTAYRAWLANPGQAELAPQASFDSYLGRDLEESLPALTDLGLVQQNDDGGLEVTERGRAFLDYLGTPEGVYYQRVAEERRGQQPALERA